MSNKWGQLAGLHRVDGSLSTPEPSETICNDLALCKELSEMAQNNSNNSIEFVQDFELEDYVAPLVIHQIILNDINALAAAPNNPLQDSEVESPTNWGLSSTSTTSFLRQNKMSSVIAKFVLQWDFYLFEHPIHFPWTNGSRACS